MQTYFPDVSIHLSNVLDEVGLDEGTLNTRRRTSSLQESAVTLQLEQGNSKSMRCHYFGSRTEGTTIPGLNSDLDVVLSDNHVNIIQNIDESVECDEEKVSMLMIQDDSVPPGYCRLQVLNCDTVDQYYLEKCTFDNKGKRLLENVIIHHMDINCKEGFVRNGPATTNTRSNIDRVSAFLCRSWSYKAIFPAVYNIWIKEMFRDIIQSGCFVVPTGHCLSEDEKLEWRISTSFAERILMRNMNVIQIKCFVMLKLIIKASIEPLLGKCVTSFHCKNVFFVLFVHLPLTIWKNENLIFCIKLGINLLQWFIRCNNIPHYFLPSNNLLAGRLNRKSRQRLLQILDDMVRTNIRVILEIRTDSVGDRLLQRLNCLPARHIKYTNVSVKTEIFSEVLWFTFYLIHSNFLKMLKFIMSDQYSVITNIRRFLLKLLNVKKGNESVEAVVKMLSTCLDTTTGSVIASMNISESQPLNGLAYKYLESGIESDAMSGRLKLICVYLCTEKYEKASKMLQSIEEKYEINTLQPVCSCLNNVKLRGRGQGFRFPVDILFHTVEWCLANLVSFPVVFTRAEINCVPHALRHEFYRCTEEELQCLDEGKEWTKFAIIDPLPLFHFLQYMTNKQLQNGPAQQMALENFTHTAFRDKYLIHADAALNVLGQCMELEGRYQDAFGCYIESLNERPTHNSAKWHISILIWKTIHEKFER
ncbi:uncharacterized protein LOC123523383 [Mercenaria mercenaria]|uniref:uncharacterized protein LOC123523383 n=1 Tax=Mercenaria mercenaria TaxID=6596 RepID=UPI00234E3C1C|nr:uncharacterized protein LOC123523383 [Mercenaria mercenaria]